MKFEADSTEQIYVRPEPVGPGIVLGATHDGHSFHR